MRRLLLLVPLAVLLVAAPPAHAGGFATVGLSSGPEGVGAGQPWNVERVIWSERRVVKSRSRQHRRSSGISPRTASRKSCTVASPSTGSMVWLISAFLSSSVCGESYPAPLCADLAVP